MADQQIDELYLDINVDMEKDTDKHISSLAEAITKLNQAVADVSNLEKYVKTLKQVSLKAVKVPNATAISKANQDSTEVKLEQKEVDDTAVQEATENMQELGKEVETTTDKVVQLNQAFKRLDTDVLHSEQISKDGKTITQVYKRATDAGYQVITIQNGIIKKLRNVAVKQKEVGDATDDAGKKAKKSSGFFAKFVKSIGRIALYRVIRMALSEIVKLSKEGTQNFAQFDDETNASISNIKNSMGEIANTLGVTLGETLQLLEPIIAMLLDGVNSLLNGINMAMASISGKNTYKKAIKQNEDYAKSLDETQNKLLSFDKFEALNSGNEETSPSEMFEEVPIPEMMGGTAEFFTEMLSLIKEILPYIKEIGDKLKPVMDKILPKIKDLIIAVLEAIQPILEVITILLDIFLDPITDAIGSIIDIVISVVEQIKGAFQMISGLLKLLTGDFDGAWEDIKKGFANMVNGIANMFIRMVNFIVDLINTILAPFDSLLEKIGADITIPHWEANANWQPYADGGEFTKGTRFIAGEAGAEIVYNNRTGGGGGVANIEQIAEAQYRGTFRALVDYGASQGNLSDISGMSVDIDGKKAGRLVAKGVANELIRLGYLH